MPRRLSSQVFSFVTAAGLCAGALAAELGEPRVSSHIGQQLVADIELTALEDPATAVQVRLASADVYRGASIDMPAVLSSLNMNVMRRDGKQFLHITSLKPVEADHLHLFVELNDGGHRSVRLATLWFTPEPTPPAPRPVPVAAVALEPAPPPLAWKTSLPRPAPTAAAAAEPAPMPPKIPQPRPAPVAAARAKPAPLPLKTPQPEPAAVHLAKAPAAPACKPQQADPVCAALDQKNADLRAQVARLEEKVKSLQDAAKRNVAPTPEKNPAPTGKVHAPPKRNEPAPMQPQAQPAGLPWNWIAAAGAAVFVLVGALRLAGMRRAKAKANLKAKASRPVAREAEPTLE